MKHNLTKIEAYYQQFINNIDIWLPEDVIDVDIEVLIHFDLLNYRDPDSHDEALTCFFNVVESPEKITLINDEYIIWIVPVKIDDVQLTYSLISSNKTPEPKPILCFVNSGVYNNSKLVLRILENFIFEIKENEKICQNLEDHQ